MDRDRIVELVDGYLDAVAKQDGEATAALFAPDASLEDPIGSEPLVGRQQLRAFYDVRRDIRMVRRIGPVSVSGATGAFQFEVRLISSNPTLGPPTEEVSLVVTEFLTFDADGLITRMTAVPDPRAHDELRALSGKADV